MRRYLKSMAAWALALCLTLALLPAAARAAGEPEPELPRETDQIPIEEQGEEESTADPVGEDQVPVTESGEEFQVPETDPATEAEEEVPVVTVVEYPMEWIDLTYTESGLTMLLDEGAGWNGTRYGDQLSGVYGDYYDAMDAAFRDGTVQYKTVNYESGGKYCAVYSVAEPLFETEWLSNADDARNAVSEKLESYEDGLRAVWTAFTRDHPAYFWIRENGSYYSISVMTQTWTDGRVEYKGRLIVNFAYILDARYQTAEMRTSLQNEIETAVSGILDDFSTGIPTVAKLAHFDQWLAVNNAYNNAAASDKNYSDTGAQGSAPWNASSALLSNLSPVCEGYAKAFKLLCDRIGVPCITVTSSNHMWNMVYVDGQWYHMDCTWNDPNVGDDSSNHSVRTYFLISQFTEGGGQNNESHVITQTLPYPTAAPRDYFNTSKTVWYQDVASGGSGGDGNQCWVAGYDGDGRMLTLGEGYAFYWTENTDRLIVEQPASGVTRQKVFTVDKNNGYRPMGAARTI